MQISIACAGDICSGILWFPVINKVFAGYICCRFENSQSDYCSGNIYNAYKLMFSRCVCTGLANLAFSQNTIIKNIFGNGSKVADTAQQAQY